MYCSHCGKKVTDTMLFCPFCGDPIVIPDQDDDEPAPGQAEETPFEPLTATDAADPDAPDDVPLPQDEEVAPATLETPMEPAAAPETTSGTAAAPETTSVRDMDQGEPSIVSQGVSAPDDAPADVATGEVTPQGDAAAELLQWSRERLNLAAEDDAPAAESAPESFSPLLLDEPDGDEKADWREEIARRKQAAEPAKQAPKMQLEESQAARLDGRAPKLEGKDKPSKADVVDGSRRSANTFVPPKAMNPNDIFMADKADGYDRYDDYDAYDSPDAPDDDYAYEEEREGSFIMRHIRGVVGLALLVVLALLFVIYAFTNAGQRSLARMNLAWSADVYTGLGYEYYQAGQYDVAGQYYERALSRDTGNYTYASSAAMSYVSGKNTEKAAAMLKKCIEIDPSRIEPYVYLLNLYPEAADRPWDVTQLIRQGYQLTGDGRLDVTG